MTKGDDEGAVLQDSIHIMKMKASKSSVGKTGNSCTYKPRPQHPLVQSNPETETALQSTSTNPSTSSE